ncbi:WS/DGAT/MGAT family O-acyltransferase [Mycobacterium deserti]|uniref:Diacylglycerol O-acyltransferase n=1 Tax=Mycobacterium deserti TaxID=2978347 RepID=A0ABT2MCF3_9MYCO|nr:wax ester/triacylglycerol synthase family O-acyltransferase [Mycobacterium deserti]MCT7659259.1 wax ester/triacylglycerol synthase family O-acyltransferase [Mycobacterium deserti]
MYRLTGFDAGMLALEGPSQPLTGCALWELDTSTMPGGFSFERFRDMLLRRLVALPEFRMKLADSALNLDTPVWVDDPRFDPDQHLHLAHLPAPGGRRELADFVAARIAERMDRSRPLWEMWVIEGLSGDDEHFGGKVAVMHRFHHVLADGVTALDMLSRLTTTEADPPPPKALDGVGTVSTRAIALDGFKRFASRPRYLVTELLPTAVATAKSRRRNRGQRMADAFTAPCTPLNGNITERRTASFIQLDLQEVKAVKDKFAVTLNDVLLAMVSDALRRYLLDRAALPDAPLLTMVPVSVFDPNREGRNQVALMVTSLCTDIADPADRLKAIAQASAAAKEDISALGPTHQQDWMQFAPGLLALAMRLYRWSGRTKRKPVYNLTTSNVPGPQEQTYLLGSAVRARYSFGPILHGNGLSLVAMSLNDKLDIGLVSCPDLVPDVWELADSLPAALKQLLAAQN